MKFTKTPIAFAAIILLAGAPLTAHAISVSFKAPASGATLTNVTYYQGTSCEVSGSDIRRVVFSLVSSSGTTYALNTETGAPWQCNLTTKNYADGNYTIRAVAYDSSSRTASASRSITIKNNTTTTTTDAKPTVSFSAPLDGGTISAPISQNSTCQVTAKDDKGIKQVQFFLDGTALNTELGSPYQCNIDNRKFTNGAHVLKAVATDTAGQAATAQITVNITGGLASTTTNTPPVVGISSPSAGATLSGTVSYAVTATDNVSVAKVDVFVASGTTAPKLVASNTVAPYSGTFTTAGLPNGAATLMAVATDDLGAQSTTERSVTISNPTGDTSSGGSSPIADSHIIGKARADVLFSNQSGYTAQAMGSHTSASSIPESGIVGPTLSSGETLRLGKEADPADSARKSFSFQVSPSDPNTSGSKRSELSFEPNIEMDKVYWVALSVFIPDWGSLSTGDDALFGTQLHSGDNSLGLSPSFGLYTSSGGRNFNVKARWSTSSSPTPSNSVKATYADRPIPFGKWTDFVFKFRHNTSGNGFLQVWMDGEQIADHTGNLGFNTPGYKDYCKFGYYNWSGSNMSSARKVLLRSPTIVADPTGSTYSQAEVRTLLGVSAGTTTADGGGTTSTIGTTSDTTTSSGDVCSTALCVATQ